MSEHVLRELLFLSGLDPKVESMATALNDLLDVAPIYSSWLQDKTGVSFRQQDPAQAPGRETVELKLIGFDILTGSLLVLTLQIESNGSVEGYSAYAKLTSEKNPLDQPEMKSVRHDTLTMKDLKNPAKVIGPLFKLGSRAQQRVHLQDEPASVPPSALAPGGTVKVRHESFVTSIKALVERINAKSGRG